MILLLAAAHAAQPVPVEVQAGGLSRGCRIIAARWSVPIHFEEVPYDPGSDLVPWERPGATTLVTKRGHLDFTYEGGAVEGVTAAIEAWKAAGEPGDYLLRQDGNALVVVPTTRHERGRTVPYEALTDRVIDLTAVNGTLSLIDTWTAALDALRLVTDLPIGDGRFQMSPRGQTIGQDRWWNPDPYGNVPLVTLSHPRAAAREIFDELLAIGGRTDEVWSIIWSIPGPGGEIPPPGLSIGRVRPVLDEAFDNLAPIPPKDPAEDHRPVP
ncbi:MAG: hypothetical protein H6738_17010 [Alphaproteobacteria bacterium]|nr:hypothetical protein [Alphaproteobacteria bacterium]MCB9698484.1 hypothetical protein [Alphaproteobacteria bacterium]